MSISIKNIFASNTEQTSINDIYNQKIRFPINYDYIILNGEKIKNNTPAYLNSDGIAMISLRQVCDLYKIEQLYWDANEKSVLIEINGLSIKFKVGESNIIWNGTSREMNGICETKVVNARDVLYVPLRTFGDAFGINVSWIKETNIAILNEK